MLGTDTKIRGAAEKREIIIPTIINSNPGFTYIPCLN